MDVLEPPTDEWPVFPSDHAPSKYARLQEGLEDSHSESAIETLLSNNDVDELLREYEVPPPSISTAGARRVMQRLCDDAGIGLGEDEEYLKPHGARRALGDELYRENPTTVQTALRHKSIETTKAAYSDIETDELNDAIDALEVTPQEDLYRETVRDHFGGRLTRLPEGSIDTDALWTELGEVLERYETQYTDGSAEALFEEMHTYRSGSLSALIIDCTDSDEPFKEYGLGHVLRYGVGRLVSDRAALESVFEEAHGRPPTSEELTHLKKIDRRTAGRMELGTDARSYTIQAFN